MEHSVCLDVCDDSDDQNTDHHSQSKKDRKANSYTCNLCDRSFTKSSNLNRHVRTHTVCDGSVDLNTGLRSSLKRHQGAYSFKCELCSKLYSKNSNLQRHLKSHTGDRPYVCERCGKSFALQRVLTIHMKIHTGERPYSCDVCEKSFIQKNSLKAHMRIHTGECPHSCTVCGQNFKQSRSYIKHMKNIHSQELPFVCDTCGDGFSGKSLLLDHEKMHSKEQLLDPLFEIGSSEETTPSLSVETESQKSYTENYVLEQHSESLRLAEPPHSLSELGDHLNTNEIGEQQPMNKSEKHLEINTKKLSYKCYSCGMKFSRKPLLVDHQKRHSREQLLEPLSRFVCSEKASPSETSQLSELARKEESERSLSDSRDRWNTVQIGGQHPFTGGVYRKGYAQRSIHERDLEMHIKKLPYKCHSCGKKFSTKPFLVKHQKMHSRKELLGPTSRYIYSEVATPFLSFKNEPDGSHMEYDLFEEVSEIDCKEEPSPSMSDCGNDLDADQIEDPLELPLKVDFTDESEHSLPLSSPNSEIPFVNIKQEIT